MTMTLIYDVSVGIIVDKHNQVLLQRKDLGYEWGPGKWCLFGGGIEEGEDPRKALIRELQEELEIDFKHIEYFKRFKHEQWSMDQKVRAGYHEAYVVPFNNNIRDISLNEGAGFSFFAKEELNGLSCIDPTLEILNSYLKSVK